MNEQKFKTGDQVQLKSGGPVMTVKEYDGGEVVCEWFDEHSKVESRSFHQDQLKPYQAQSRTTRI